MTSPQIAREVDLTEPPLQRKARRTECRWAPGQTEQRKRLSVSGRSPHLLFHAQPEVPVGMQSGVAIEGRPAPIRGKRARLGRRDLDDLRGLSVDALGQADVHAIARNAATAIACSALRTTNVSIVAATATAAVPAAITGTRRSSERRLGSNISGHLQANSRREPGRRPVLAVGNGQSSFSGRASTRA